MKTVAVTFIDRWWPVLIAILLVVAYPPLGLAFAAVMTFTQREDDVLFRWLLVIAAIAVVLVALPIVSR